MKKIIFAGLTAAVMTVSAIPNVFADAEDINEIYDDVKIEIDCESELSGLTLNDGAPDGTSYYSYTGESEFTGLEKMSADTSDAYMWEADVRFDEVYSGFTVKSQYTRDKVETCVRRYDGKTEDQTPKLAVQTGGSAYTEYVEIDEEAWYHIQLIARYGTSCPVLMKLYKWEDGEMTYIAEYDNVNARNNQSASYIAIQPNTSFDNVRITKLGADTLTVSTVPAGITQINAGSSATMQFAATRNGRDINKPEVEWKVYEGDNEITDGSVTVSSDGEATAAADCYDKTVTVKVASTEKGNLEGSYDLTIKSVNFDDEKFDNLALSADNDCVREGEPLSLTVSATKNGEAVELSDGDIVWKFYNEDNVQDTGNQYIYVEDNTLYVTDKVISQNIVVHAESESGVISANLPVAVKAADALESGETGAIDRLLAADACEKVIDGISSGSWDGSHYYYLGAAYDMTSVDATTEDILIEFDMRFGEEGSGIKLRNSGNSKEGGQIAFQSGKIGRVGASNKFVAFTDGNTEDWYHIEILARCGSSDDYGKAYIYKYDENGNRVNPENAASNQPIEGTLDLRTMSSSTQAFHHIQVQAGSGIDNMRIIKIVPDEVSLTLSSSDVFAGNSVQGSCSVLRKGIEIPSYPAARLTWAVYDSEDKYPADTELIKVDASGLVSIDATAAEQTIYIRVTETNSGIYQSLPLEIKGSDIFTVTGFGLNEENTAITELKVEKNFYYSGDAAFIVALYDADGALIDIASRSMRDNTLAVGENRISIDDIELPEDFGSVKAMIWTSP